MPNTEPSSPRTHSQQVEDLVDLAIDAIPGASRDDEFYLALAHHCFDELDRPGSPIRHQAAQAAKDVAFMREDIEVSS